MYTLSEITHQLGGQWRGQDVTVSALASAKQATAQDITFLANAKYKQEVLDSRAAAVIISSQVADLFTGRNLILVDNPYLYFAQVARLFHPIAPVQAGIHPTAVIEASAIVPPSCEIGANVYIGANTVLGEHCRILANCVIEHDCILGEGVFLHPNVTIYSACVLGHRVEIHSGTVIGADGFGLAFTGQDWFKIPQVGGVILGDDVEIGSNSNVDRGALSPTTVGKGSKIDNQVQIAHNCQIGEHTVIAAQTGISGSTKVGNFCIIGGGVGTVGHIEIADNTQIGGGTSVTHSIKKSGQHYASIYPMQTYKEWAHNAVHIRHLSDINKRIKALETKLSG